MLLEALSYTGVPSCLAPGPRVTEAGDTGSVPENPRDGWAVALGWMAHGRRPLGGMRVSLRRPTHPGGVAFPGSSSQMPEPQEYREQKRQGSHDRELCGQN